MGEDGVENSIHGSDVLKGAHRAGASSDFAESAFDSVGGSHRLALIAAFVAETGEKLVEIVAQTDDGGRILALETAGELSRRSTRSRQIGRVHDLVESALDPRLIGPSDLIEDIADLVRPAALNGNIRKGGGESGDETTAAIDADHLDAFTGQAAAIKVGEEAFPFGGAFALGQAEVDDLLLAVGPQAERHQHRPPEGARPGLAGEHHAVKSISTL